MIKGFDFLAFGHPKWPVEATIKYTPKGYGIGCFHDVFGLGANTLVAVEQACISEKFPLIRVHIGYTPGEKKPLTEVHHVAHVAAKYDLIAARYPKTVIYLSHTCEYSDQDDNHTELRDEAIRRLAPHCIAVDSVMNVPAATGLLEIHTPSLDSKLMPKFPYGVSLDGFDARYVNLRSFLQVHSAFAVYAFIWLPGFNLKRSAGENTPIEKRTFIPDAAYIRAAVKMMR